MPNDNSIQEIPQNTDNSTFDYNQLYVGQETTTANTEDLAVEQEITPTIQETPIVFEETIKQQEEVVRDVIPSFDANALEGNDALSHDELINSMKSDTQQENAEFKKNWAFIAAFFGVIIFAIVFIFPLLAQR